MQIRPKTIYACINYIFSEYVKLYFQKILFCSFLVGEKIFRTFTVLPTKSMSLLLQVYVYFKTRTWIYKCFEFKLEDNMNKI